MFGWLIYWLEEKRKLRRQMQELNRSRWERRNRPAFHRKTTRWVMVRTL